MAEGNRVSRRQIRERRERRARLMRRRRIIRAAGIGVIALAILLVLIFGIRAIAKLRKGNNEQEKAKSEVQSADVAETEPEEDTGHAARTQAVTSGEGKTGWNVDAKGWWYLNEDGTQYVDGWQEIAGVRYFFMENGYLATGWQVIDGEDVFFRESGVPEDGKEIRYVALTFDEGPSEFTEQILTALGKYDAKATFFVAGGHVEAHATTMQHLLDDGMEIGNYTYDNEPLTGYEPLAVTGAVRITDDLISEAVGITPELVRPPGGKVDEIVLANVGKPAILWSVPASDIVVRDEATGTYSVDVGAVPDGAIIRVMDTYQDAPDRTKALCEALYNEGFKMVTVTELARVSNVTMEEGVSYRGFRDAINTKSMDAPTEDVYTEEETNNDPGTEEIEESDSAEGEDTSGEEAP